EERPAGERQESGPLILRVGLATDLEQLTLPCCDPRTALWLDGGPLTLTSSVRVRPGGNVSHTAVYRLQVAALKDERQAQGIAEYLSASSGHVAESVFDADTDLYRVRVGEFESRETAEQARGGLAGLGVTEAWVVSEGGELGDPSFDLDRAGRRFRVEGRWLEVRQLGTRSSEEGSSVEPAEGAGIPFGATRYRGKLLIFLNERGLLNVVNELTLEEYLRGVVPKEMGPELYNEIEALKAQTVAARTYTLRNLGEFADEGYDICSTPRCQVYGGMGVEHPRSDRAIEATAGQVLLYHGQPAETFYSATCGGHTENVEVVFPLKKGDYLRGVPCLEAGITRIEGNLARGTDWPSGLLRELLPSSGAPPARDLAGRLEHLALLAGLPTPRDRLASTERAEVMRYVRSLFDMVLDRRMITSPDRLRELLDDPPEGWRLRDRRLAAFLRFGRWLEPDRAPGTTSEEIDSLLLELALYLGELEEVRGHFLAARDGELRARAGSEHRTYDLPSSFATFRRNNGGLSASALDLMAGDRLRLYLREGRPLALVQPLDSPPVDFGRRAPKRQWTLYKTLGELRRAVQKRYPGFPFEDFEVIERGVSGRVGKLALHGENGQRIVVEGLAVRWTLDVWDTLFWVEKRPSASGEPGWLFRGRGWGHGVGMSQAGAFGMAVRGLTYREILEHYYTGVELGRLKPAPPRPRLPSG
ncbi:MAG: SpoIID/LytB domain-containing protein, partial [Holophagales bacterium]|nr:SpoIID/LytB domain-containing protein [Holophagales bacterium]